MPDGTNPLKLLPLRLKTATFASDVKSSWSRVPVILAPERFIPEIVVPALLQTIPVQLQRLVTLLRDHESREEDDKLFFHLTRACASVVADELMFKGRNEEKMI